MCQRQCEHGVIGQSMTLKTRFRMASGISYRFTGDRGTEKAQAFLGVSLGGYLHYSAILAQFDSSPPIIISRRFSL
jgi:hypothetical protein